MVRDLDARAADRRACWLNEDPTSSREIPGGPIRTWSRCFYYSRFTHDEPDGQWLSSSGPQCEVEPVRRHHHRRSRTCGSLQHRGWGAGGRRRSGVRASKHPTTRRNGFRLRPDRPREDDLLDHWPEERQRHGPRADPPVRSAQRNVVWIEELAIGKTTSWTSTWSINGVPVLVLNNSRNLDLSANSTRRGDIKIGESSA